MGKLVPDAIIDLMLAEAEGTAIHICTAEPANYAGISAVQLATATISGSYAKANGDTSGRKNTLPAQTDLSIATTGSATHVVVSNGSDTMRLVTTCTTQALTSGGTVSTSAFAHEILDAS
jgi:hypothetical protein